MAQIESYEEIEAQMRTVLAKQKPVVSYLERNINFAKKYESLNASVPKGIVMEKVYIDQNTLRLTGKAETELSFSTFLANIKKMESLSYLNIRDTNFEQNTKSVTFTIQATYK